jgi:hypothetical protein
VNRPLMRRYDMDFAAAFLAARRAGLTLIAPVSKENRTPQAARRAAESAAQVSVAPVRPKR